MLSLVAAIVARVIDIVVFLILVRALISFVPHSPRQPLIRLLYDVTEPILKPFRRFQLGGQSFAVDFSPLLAMIVLQFIVRPLLITIINMFAGRGY